jgi:hypothetical protein
VHGADADIVNRDDPRMAELGQTAGFLDEQLRPLLNLSVGVRYLDRHGAIEPMIVSTIDGPKTPLAEAVAEFVSIPKRGQQAGADLGKTNVGFRGVFPAGVRIRNMVDGFGKRRILRDFLFRLFAGV